MADFCMAPGCRYRVTDPQRRTRAKQTGTTASARTYPQERGRRALIRSQTDSRARRASERLCTGRPAGCAALGLFIYLASFLTIGALLTSCDALAVNRTDAVRPSRRRV